MALNTSIATNIKVPQEAFDWYDEYAHGDIDRRTFLRRLSTLAIAGLTLNVISAALLPNYALAEQVSFNDASIKASYTIFDSPLGHGKGRGYLVMPAELKGPAPLVLVVHENRGLNPYIEDVARRLAKQGYIAFAPDALFPVGGYPGNDDEGRTLQKSLSPEKIEHDFIAAARFLKQLSIGNGKLGVVGFCYGGYMSNFLAAMLPDDIDAAVPFYGTPPKDLALISQIKSPLLLHFAALDQRVNATWPDYEAKLKAIKANYQAYHYAEVNHGFHNDSTARYHAESAELAWQRTLLFFTEHLS